VGHASLLHIHLRFALTVLHRLPDEQLLPLELGGSDAAPVAAVEQDAVSGLLPGRREMRMMICATRGVIK
jgi:hypothetical protein